MILLPGYLHFKQADAQSQFVEAPMRLREVVLWAAEYAFSKLSKPQLTITRVRDAIEHGSESGVHPAGRGCDLRDQFVSDSGLVSLFTPLEVDTLVNSTNAQFPRADNHLTCIHHAANGDPLHFHFQIPYTWLSPEERTRFS